MIDSTPRQSQRAADQKILYFEYTFLYTISGEYMALVYVICICDILLHISKK